MNTRYWPAIKRERQAMPLAALVVLQALSALFFIGDVAIDLYDGSHLDDLHVILEAVAALALTAGVIYLMRELRGLLNRLAAMEFGIRAARGEMNKLIDVLFEQWRLTPSERDIANLVLKGIDNDSIGRMRGTAQGTVRAQCTRIYAKAKVDSRAQFLSIFLEELFYAEKS